MVKFDYIISNPPYNIGNAITKAVVDNVDFDNFINLMPASKYKGNELYKNVVKVESVEDFFDDAAVGDSLTISLLGKEYGPYATYDEFENEKRDPQYREFYKLNGKCRVAYEYIALPKRPFIDKPDIDFMLTMRTIQNGVHKLENKREAADIAYNIRNDNTNIPYDKTYDRCSCAFIRFKTPIEKINLSRFWYYNPLMNVLLKGLNSSSGRVTTAIPNIDYSVDRDYEHLTLDDIMKILKEEN